MEEYSSLQAAIKAASSGDLKITVVPDSYYEVKTFHKAWDKGVIDLRLHVLKDVMEFVSAFPASPVIAAAIDVKLQCAVQGQSALFSIRLNSRPLSLLNFVTAIWLNYQAFNAIEQDVKYQIALVQAAIAGTIPITDSDLKINDPSLLSEYQDTLLSMLDSFRKERAEMESLWERMPYCKIENLKSIGHIYRAQYHTQPELFAKSSTR